MSKSFLFKAKFAFCLLILFRIAKEPYSFIDKTIACFDDTGISSSQYLKSLKENIRVYEAHAGYSLKCRIWQFRLKLIYLLLQSSIGKQLFLLKKKMRMENV